MTSRQSGLSQPKQWFNLYSIGVHSALIPNPKPARLPTPIASHLYSIHRAALDTLVQTIRHPLSSICHHPTQNTFARKIKHKTPHRLIQYIGRPRSARICRLDEMHALHMHLATIPCTSLVPTSAHVWPCDHVHFRRD